MYIGAIHICPELSECNSIPSLISYVKYIVLSSDFLIKECFLSIFNLRNV